MGYKLPESLRSSLRTPIGKLFTGEPLEAAKAAKIYIAQHNPPLVISIGDYCTETLFGVDFYPDIIIFDEKTLRMKKVLLNLESYSVKRVINPPEWICTTSWNLIKSSISFCTANKSRVSIRVDGEEDLLAIPAIISSPLGSIIIYGQPPITTEAGIVVVITNHAIRKRMNELLKSFNFQEEFCDGN